MSIYEKFEHVRELNKHCPELLAGSASIIQLYQLEAVISQLVEHFGYESIKKSIIDIRKRDDLSIQDVTDHLIAFHLDYSINSPFENQFQFTMGDIRFSRVKTYKEFFDLGRELKNCLFGPDRFHREAFKNILLKISRKDALIGLVSLQEREMNEWIIYDMKAKNNKEIPNSNELNKMIISYMTEMGCSIKSGKALNHFASQRRQSQVDIQALREIARTT